MWGLELQSRSRGTRVSYVRALFFFFSSALLSHLSPSLSRRFTSHEIYAHVCVVGDLGRVLKASEEEEHCVSTEKTNWETCEFSILGDI